MKVTKKRRKVLDSFATKLGISRQEEWYNFTTKDIATKEGKLLLSCYRNSLFSALKDLYPEFEWNPFHCKKIPSESSNWNDIQNQRKFLEFIAEQLNIQKPEDWYSVPLKSIRQLGGRTLLHLHHNSLLQTLQCAFPDHEWKSSTRELQLRQLRLQKVHCFLLSFH